MGMSALNGWPTVDEAATDSLRINVRTAPIKFINLAFIPGP